MSDREEPPGAPGIPPRWTSSAKSAIGTALRPSSRVWFTVSHGIFNEIYYPRIDQACVRDLGFLVSDGKTFFSEEKRDAVSRVEWVAPGVPAFRVVNVCREGRYRITKHIVSDPDRDVVLQQTQFEGLADGSADYQVYALLAPHLANGGQDNTAWVGDYKGVPMLFAERHGTCLALACAPGWKRASTGFVGFSDGWQDLSQHKTMTWMYPRAENGNVALIGEVDLTTNGGSFVLALAFGGTPAVAQMTKLSPRTFGIVAGEFSSLQVRGGERTRAPIPDTVIRLLVRRAVRGFPGNGAHTRAFWGTAVRTAGQHAVVIRRRRLKGTTRRPPIGWPQRVPGAQRPRATSELPARRLRCQSTFHPASVPRNAECGSTRLCSST